jgi:integrase
VELFLAEKRKSRRQSTVDNHKDRLGRHFPFKAQLADITHQDIVRRLSKVSSNSEHDHALSVAKTFFTWCRNRRYIDDNPTRGLSPHGSHSRARVLSDAELKSIWVTSEKLGTFGIIVRLLILTGQRRGEIAALRAEYCDLRGGTSNALVGDALHNPLPAPSQCTITLPSSLTKNGREHTFPIGELSRFLLTPCITRTTSGVLFSGRGSTSTHFNGWSKSKAALDEISGVTDWTLHDLRRATRCGARSPRVVPCATSKSTAGGTSGSTFASCIASKSLRRGASPNLPSLS